MEELKHVLIVEDDKAILKLLELTLQKMCKTTCAENGVEALNCVKESKPDLILSDNMMPEMNGIEFKEELNKSDDYKNIPFIFLTAISDIKTKEKALEIGATQYLVKPVRPQVIRDVVKSILEIQ